MGIKDLAKEAINFKINQKVEEKESKAQTKSLEEIDSNTKEQVSTLEEVKQILLLANNLQEKWKNSDAANEERKRKEAKEAEKEKAASVTKIEPDEKGSALIFLLKKTSEKGKGFIDSITAQIGRAHV